MQSREEGLRNQIALGWVMILLIIVVMLEFMIIGSSLQDPNFMPLDKDPGRLGLRLLTYIFGLYALMPVYVHLVHGARTRIFRWLAVAVAVLGFLYFLLHHLAHWNYGQRPEGITHVFDIVLHLLSIWVIVNSVQWARYPRTVTE